MKQFTINEIGVIYNDYENPKIVVHEDYKAGLKGLEGFSHIKVLYWFDQFDSPEIRKTLVMEKPYVSAPEELGVFATRSPVRPNLIAVSATPIKEIDFDQGVIYLYYIDAEDNTPLLDIKPYTPSVDIITSWQVPIWCQHWPKSYEDAEEFDWEKEFNW